MGDLLGNILNSVTSGGSASNELTEILKKVAKSQSASKSEDNDPGKEVVKATEGQDIELDFGTILGAILGGSQPSGGLAGSLPNANIGDIAKSVISVIGMASSAFDDSK